jgi:virulence-associated protein VagC
MEHRDFKIQKQVYRYRSVTIPNQTSFIPGDTVSVFYDGALVIIVPRGTTINEKLLKRAITPPVTV